MGEKTRGDVWFEQCLRERGYDPREHEPDVSRLGVSKRPDYLATNAIGEEAAFEVKSFGWESQLGRRVRTMEVVTAGPGQVFGPVREQVAAAAAQLKGLAGEMPAVIVLDNPESAPVHLDVQSVLAALYGNPQFSVPINTATGGTTGPSRYELGRDGKLTTSHSYVSAVAVLQPRTLRQDAVDALVAEVKAQPGWHDMSTTDQAQTLYEAVNAKSADFPDGKYFFVDVIDTMSASLPEGPAVRLPDSWFAGPRDSRWRYNCDGCYHPVWTPDAEATS